MLLCAAVGHAQPARPIHACTCVGEACLFCGGSFVRSPLRLTIHPIVLNHTLAFHTNPTAALPAAISSRKAGGGRGAPTRSSIKQQQPGRRVERAKRRRWSQPPSVTDKQSSSRACFPIDARARHRSNLAWGSIRPSDSTQVRSVHAAHRLRRQGLGRRRRRWMDARSIRQIRCLGPVQSS